MGLDVVRAARICTEGRGGQILLSETTRALLGSGLPEGVSLFPLGQRHLRGIDEPERVYEIAIEDLEQEPPEPLATQQAGAPEPVEADTEQQFRDFGDRLAADIQERVLRSLGGSLDRAAAPPDADRSGVDDIAERMKSLGDEIDARVMAALARKGWRKESEPSS